MPALVFLKLQQFYFLILLLFLNVILLKFIKQLNNSSIKINYDNSFIKSHSNEMIFEQLIENLNEGIIAISSTRDILFQNVKLSRIHSNRKTSYDSFSELPLNLISEIQSCFTSHERIMAKEYEYNNTYLLLSIIPSINDRIVSSVTVILKDVTNDKKLINLKTELVTNISHELKTPLTSILGYSELLLENSKDLNDIEIKYLNKILYNSNKLISIYDSLLSLSSIENSKELLKHEVLIQELITKSYEKLQLKYSNKSVSLDTTLDYKTIKVNTDLFETAIYNILENSFKYSLDDLKIHISLQKEGHSYVLKFTDNGIGISKDKKNKIFQRFYRINESRSDDIQGLGLGLSLVKNIIEKHNGSVQVGEINKGAQIILIIPR